MNQLPVIEKAKNQLRKRRKEEVKKDQYIGSAIAKDLLAAGVEPMTASSLVAFSTDFSTTRTKMLVFRFTQREQRCWFFALSLLMTIRWSKRTEREQNQKRGSLVVFSYRDENRKRIRTDEWKEERTNSRKEERNNKCGKSDKDEKQRTWCSSFCFLSLEQQSTRLRSPFLCFCFSKVHRVETVCSSHCLQFSSTLSPHFAKSLSFSWISTTVSCSWSSRAKGIDQGASLVLRDILI